ncbi:MAG: hypothetical protein MJ252_05225 [archaeon]|nr:hypothetical protein [archaeon]
MNFFWRIVKYLLNLRKLFKMEKNDWCYLIPHFRPTRYIIVLKSRFSSFFESLKEDKSSGSDSPNINEEGINNNFNNLQNIFNSDTQTVSGNISEDQLKLDRKKRYGAINIDNIRKGIEHKTTVVIKNIPQSYSMENFIFLLRYNQINHFNLIYFPIKTRNQKNFGFAFINFISPIYIIDFYEKFQSKMNEEKSNFYELYYCYNQGIQKIKRHYSPKFIMEFNSI